MRRPFLFAAVALMSLVVLPPANASASWLSQALHGSYNAGYADPYCGPVYVPPAPYVQYAPVYVPSYYPAPYSRHRTNYERGWHGHDSWQRDHRGWDNHRHH